MAEHDIVIDYLCSYSQRLFYVVIVRDYSCMYFNADQNSASLQNNMI